MAAITIIGYGNLMRGDDAAGILAARELEAYFRGDEEVKIAAVQQLTPEMAEMVARSSFVLFLDACNEQEPGTIRCIPVDSELQACRFTHHLTPAALLNAAQQLYGQAAPAATLTLTGWSFALNDEVSSGVRERLPEFIRQAKELIETHK